MTLPWKTSWVTGASSGIGREVALKLARSGVKVAVSARSADKLDELAREHPAITAYPVDVTSRDEMTATAGRVVAALGTIDLAVLNAGIWQPQSARNFSAGAAAESMSVNYLGVANALEPLIPYMTGAGKGQLALVSSVAGYRGLPKASAYAPSKAAVISLAEVLRAELASTGVIVSVVNPGFVSTPMTAVNDFPMPYIITPEDAAERIVRGLARGKFEVTFPWQLATIMKVLRLLPYGLYFRIAERL